MFSVEKQYSFLQLAEQCSLNLQVIEALELQTEISNQTHNTYEKVMALRFKAKFKSFRLLKSLREDLKTFYSDCFRF